MKSSSPVWRDGSETRSSSLVWRDGRSTERVGGAGEALSGVQGESGATLQRLESSRAMGQWSGAHDNSSFGSSSSSLAFDTAQDVDEAKPESSWTALAKVEGKRLVEH